MSFKASKEGRKEGRNNTSRVTKKGRKAQRSDERWALVKRRKERVNEKSQNDKSMPSNGRKYLEEISKMHKNQEGVPNDGVTNMKNVDTIHEKGRHEYNVMDSFILLKRLQIITHLNPM